MISRGIAFALIVAGFVVLGIVLLLSGAQAWPAYLWALWSWLGVSLGAWVLLMIRRFTGGAWADNVRWPAEAAVLLLPLSALLMLPLLFNLPALYAWATPAAVAQETSILQRLAFMNAHDFSIRALIYFFIWWLVSWLFLNQSALVRTRLSRDDGDGLKVWSGVGLIVYAITVTAAATDFLLSLNIQWHSTVFGALMASSQVLMALAFLVLTGPALAQSRPVAQLPRPPFFHDMGNLLLTFLLFWMYLLYSQYITIWVGDLPHVISWYLPRSETSWQWLSLFVVVVGFVLPLSALLLQKLKRNDKALRGVAALILVTQTSFVFWLIKPSLYPQGFAFDVYDALVFFSYSAIWIGVYALVVGRERALQRWETLLQHTTAGKAQA